MENNYSQNSAAGLPAWRMVIEPHPDVVQGRYKVAEFAADLAQVASGKGTMEYCDPALFFERTFVTEGMAGLLEQALRRVSGKDGEPVIQLKTAFGGGKTHSMLALFHMLGGNVSIDKAPSITPILERAEVDALPKTNIAVLVGTALEPANKKRPPNLPGVTVNTLWGEMAAQLAVSAGKPEIYELVKESDKKGVSPGSATLTELFNAAAPAVVLIDELVAYAKKIGDKKDLPGGTFDNLTAFIQEITEAARASQNGLVVASIPESEREVGNETGRAALNAIEHTFGRMDAVWKPVTAGEGFEIVRRRLFVDCRDKIARDKVCAAFSRMYGENSGDFPVETKELEYKERMIACYPIHPEVFDRLYTDWSTLENFQRTRGVLRLMAAVVHELWMRDDMGAMIMPGSLPLDVPSVKNELMRYLGDLWNGIMDREVDGKESVPFKEDKKTSRYGRSAAARRVARTIMLGSAPTGREQRIRGIESIQIRLGTVQPGENISLFNDALGTLKDELSYLYNSSNNRYWFDNRPTLKKIAEDLAGQQSPADAAHEIETRLDKWSKKPPLEGLHKRPGNSNDVPDEQGVRLVLLRPNQGHRSLSASDGAMAAINDIMENRGASKRIYKNMLVFLAPDADLMMSLTQTVKRYLAWKSIKNDSVTLNLDHTQTNEVEAGLKKANEDVDNQLRNAYKWLFAPYTGRDLGVKSVSFEKNALGGGDEDAIVKAVKSLVSSEYIIGKWTPMLLKMELDKLLWKDSNHIQIKTLWENLCQYCYLPRLVNFAVLETSIREGVNSSEYFAYAAGIDGNGRYVDLKFNQYVGMIDHTGYIVKIDVAKKQIEAEKARLTAQTKSANVAERDNETAKDDEDNSSAKLPQSANTGGNGSGVTTPAPPPSKKRFFMSTEIDTQRAVRDVQKLMEEIITHLTAEDGASVKITLEVDAEVATGFSQQTVRTVSENCNALHVGGAAFED